MKLHRLLGALCAGLMLLALPVRAAEQSSYVMPVAGPMSMATFAGTHLNPALRALATCHNGSSAPANGTSGVPLGYQCWIDTTANPSLYKIYDGASWVTLGSLNTSTHVWLPYLTGGASGGVPYFSAANVMGTSAALAQYGFVVGGGAGAAPATIAACSDNQIAFGVSSSAPLCRSVTGDITFAAGVAAIGANKVANAMLRQSGALAVVGRSANSTGDVADIQATAASDAVLRESGSVLGFGTVATGGIANDAVTDAKLRNSGALSVIGRAANSSGDPADIAAVAASDCVFRESGSTVGCGTVATAGIAANAVTFAKFQQIAALSMFGNCTNATANGAAVTGIADQVLRVNGAGTACAFGAIDLSKAAAATGTIQTASVPAFAGGDVTGAGGSLVLTIGATKVTSAMLNADVFSTAHSWGGVQTFASPVTTGTFDIQEAVTLSGDISPTQLAANTNDWAPTGFSTASAVRFSTDASRNVTGLAGGADGRIIILHNVGSFNAVLTNQDANSTAANRFLFGGDLTLLPDYSVTLRYDATSSRWRAITTATAGGGGGVTSVTIAAGAGMGTFTGTCVITTTGTCTIVGSGKQLPGTATNDSASAGNVGEFVTAQRTRATATSLTTATPVNTTSISLTAGDWNVFGVAGFGGASTSALVVGGSSTTSATLPGLDSGQEYAFPGLNVSSGDASIPIPMQRFSLAATTTIYLIGYAEFSVGTVNAYGTLSARRVR